MGGPGERARARQLLEQGVLLKQGFAGAKDHPGVGAGSRAARIAVIGQRPPVSSTGSLQP